MRSLLIALAALVVLMPSASAADPGILYALDARGVAITQASGQLWLSLPAGTPEHARPASLPPCP